jgi:single-strand DNA-binding protein
MLSLNKVLLIGNLTRDPELRYTPSGQAVCHFGMAVNRMYNDRAGQRQKETCFLRITVWGKVGENCASYLKKGRAVFVQGRLQSRSWESEGQKKSSLDVVADDVQFLDAPAGQRALAGAGAGASGAGGQGAGAGGSGESAESAPPPDFEAAEDDIPF